MTTALGVTYVNLVDAAKRTDPDGSVADIIEVIAESNTILGDANAFEGNLATGHRSTQRTTQPSGTWRKLNEGVTSAKSTTEQVDDTCGMLAKYSAIDVTLAKLNGNSASFMASEDNAFVMGLGEDAVDAIIYGNAKLNPEQPHGFAPRYNLTTGTTGTNVITCGGSGDDNTSMWLITWGPKQASVIYPKGMQAGLQSKDLGEIPWEDASYNNYQAYVTYFEWYLGLAVMDWRYVVRLCNIDVSDLTTDASAGADLMVKMVTGYYKRPTIALGNMAKTFWYCNKTVAEYLHHQASNKANVNLTLANPGGEPMVSFLGAPVHVCDAITSAEATIS